MYEGQDKNPEMCRVLLTHEVMCRWVFPNNSYQRLTIISNNSVHLKMKVTLIVYLKYANILTLICLTRQWYAFSSVSGNTNCMQTRTAEEQRIYSSCMQPPLRWQTINVTRHTGVQSFFGGGWLIDPWDFGLTTLHPQTYKVPRVYIVFRRPRKFWPSGPTELSRRKNASPTDK